MLLVGKESTCLIFKWPHSACLPILSPTALTTYVIIHASMLQLLHSFWQLAWHGSGQQCYLIWLKTCEEMCGVTMWTKIVELPLWFSRSACVHYYVHTLTLWSLTSRSSISPLYDVAVDMLLQSPAFDIYWREQEYAQTPVHQPYSYYCYYNIHANILYWVGHLQYINNAFHLFHT
jgi:hypothetical protein